MAEFLRTHFSNEDYAEAIEYLRYEVKNYQQPRDTLDMILKNVKHRSLDSSQVMKLVNYFANQLLMDNTDEEAYRWLDLMIENVLREDGEIAPYPESIHDMWRCDKELLKQFREASAYAKIGKLLSLYFNYEAYEIGISDLRKAISGNKALVLIWNEAVEVVKLRSLPTHQPLYLVNVEANQVIWDNTDEEAYRWLDLMIENVERGDGKVAPYPESVHDVDNLSN